MTDSLSRIFMGTAYLLERLFPDIKFRLKQAYITEDSTTYLSKTVLYCLLVFLIVSAGIIAVFRSYHSEKIYVGPVLALALTMFMFYYRMNKPNMIIKRRVRNIEKNLVFAAQSLYVQISSGAPIYDAMVSVSVGKYGEISREFRVAIDEIKSGKPLAESLEELAMRNPSPYFQKIIWQIVNTIKAGGSMTENLNDIVKTLSRDQINVIKTYGAQLSPLSMAYMLVAVIVPSLGITILITISSLPNVGGSLSTSMFWWILAITLILQAQFAMIIHSTRPNLIGE